MSASMFLKTPEGVSLAPGDGGGLVFQGPWCRLAIREADPGPFAALATTGGYEDVLARTALRSSGPAGMARFYYYLGRLVERGFVVRSACLDGRLLASLVPVSPAFRLAAARAEPAHRLALSRFAFIRRHEARACLESPRAHARVVLYDRRVAELVQALMEQPRAEGADDEPLCGLPSEAAEATLDLLWSAGMLTELDVNGAPAEDADPALRCWEFHDLLFHARSRMGRTDLRFGATYALAGVVTPPPALKPVSVAEAVPLERPDLARLEREDPPLAWAMEHRCSVREYAAEPMTAGQLGEFLFRVARVREVISREILTTAGPMTMDIAPRPYPAGGALYELEVYAVVRACAGIGPGIYYYDPCGHRLVRLRGPTDECGLLLEDAALCAGVDSSTLQVLLIYSARFPRVSWKYSGLAYSLVLKHVGIVQQSMYLVATAMGLGGCALGAGDSDLFARAVGTDYYAETSVGEFLLGSVPRGGSAPLEVSAPAPQNRTVPLTGRGRPPGRRSSSPVRVPRCGGLGMRKIFYLFGQLTDADIEWMLSKGKRERIRAGTSIVREGQPIDSLFILLDGVLEVTGPGLGTDKPIRLGCGEVVGEISFVDSRPPTATVTATADAVVLSIPRAALLEKLKQDHELAARFYRALAMFLSQRLRDTGRRLGYGRSELAPAGTEVEGELGEEVLDNIHMAGHRFDHVLQRLLGT